MWSKLVLPLRPRRARDDQVVAIEDLLVGVEVSEQDAAEYSCPAVLALDLVPVDRGPRGPVRIEMAHTRLKSDCVFVPVTEWVAAGSVRLQCQLTQLAAVLASFSNELMHSRSRSLLFPGSDRDTPQLPNPAGCGRESTLPMPARVRAADGRRTAARSPLASAVGKHSSTVDSRWHRVFDVFLRPWLRRDEPADEEDPLAVLEGEAGLHLGTRGLARLDYYRFPGLVRR